MPRKIVSMRFDVITVFPEAFASYLNTSILRRAQARGLIKVCLYNLRNFTEDKRRTVDDRPYGGGAGMVLMAKPILEAVDSIKPKAKTAKAKIIVLSAKGRQFNQKVANEWAKKYTRLILISGRYEGVDERVRQALRAEEISIGPYVLTDGDAPAMVVISALARLIPGVIKLESLQEESHWNLLLKKEKRARSGRGIEYPHYTRPELLTWRGKRYRVPVVLLSGDHKRIAEWRQKHGGL